MIQIINTSEYREGVISLWQSCFGDKREYIEFFLDECPHTCIGIISDNVPVSMLFLLNGVIDKFRAAYIYAACTDEKFRCRGYMAQLIEFTKKYCAVNNYESLFLVPAEESLYEYYSKFGFISSFEKSVYDVYVSDLSSYELTEITDTDEILRIRNSFLDNICSFRFDNKTAVYAIKEHFFNGGKVFINRGENADFIAFITEDSEKNVIKEFLGDKSVKMLKNIEHFLNIGKENIYIHCPIVYNNTDKMAKTAKCGMYYPLTDEMKNSSVNKKFYAGLFLD